MHPLELRRRRELRIAGYTDHEIRQRLRTGVLSAVRPGTYLPGAPPDDAVARHALAARAAHRDLADAAVFSHVTAAVLHGWPIWGIDLARVHVTRSRSGGGRCGRRVHVHAVPLRPDEIVLVEGLPVTGPARTLADLGRQEPFEQAVAVADAALRAGQVTPEELAEAVGRAGRRPGAPAARRALRFADGRSESVGESRSRVAMLRAGLPVPVLQWPVHDAHGRLLGRTDFGWPSLRTAGEFDGRIKYGRLLRPGQTAADAVLAEKQREDAIRAEDLAVVRWTWADLADFTPIADRLRRRFRPA
ncbi:MAG TPA: hypothetical protein VNP92_02970 [Actinophytocola sp.]|nr:hypothetical protein [Actinophytocola sp.]